MSENEKSPLEKEREKTLKLIEKEGIENKSFESIPDSELEDASEDPETPEYAEESEEQIAPTYKSGESEVKTKKDPRFSRKIEIDEEALRENARETDTSQAGGGTN